MKKTAVKILSALLMLSMVFSTNVFAANDETTSAWDSFLGLFGGTATSSAPVVQYRAHIQDLGDMPKPVGTYVTGPTEMGTRGQFLRMEGFWLKSSGLPAGVHLTYQVHVQNEGWMNWVGDDQFAGTEGKMQRIEAIKIKLVDAEGDPAVGYSVQYKGHVQDKGDLPANDPDYTGTTGWYVDGQQLGTTGSSLRLEALQVQIVSTVDMTDYNAAVAEAVAVDEADYTAASYAALEQALIDNLVTADNTQEEVDAATAAINAAIDALVEVLKVTSVTATNDAGTVANLSGATILSNSKITVMFNKEVDSTTVSTSTFRVFAGSVVQATGTVAVDSTDKHKVTIEASAGGYTLSKAAVLKIAGVKDTAGNALGTATDVNFNISAKPVVLTQTYSDGSVVITSGSTLTSINANQSIDYLFNTDMSASSVTNTANVKLYNVTDSAWLALGTLTYNSGTKTLNVAIPANTLETDKEYKMVFTSGVQSMDGVSMNATEYKYFTGTPATLTATTPADEATGVYNSLVATPGKSAIKWVGTFGTAVDPATVIGENIKLRELTATGTVVATTISYDSASATVTLTPAADLKASTKYYVTWTADIKGTDGRSITADNAWFVTGDFAKPSVVSSTPANAAVDVAVDGSFVFNFNKAMNTSTFTLGTNVTLQNLTSNQTFAGFTSWTKSWSDDNKTLTIKPTSTTKLEPGKTYKVTIKKAVTDVASPGNPMAADYTVTFNSATAAATKLVNVKSGTNLSTDAVLASGVTNQTSSNDYFINYDQALKTEAGSYSLDTLVTVQKLDVATGVYVDSDVVGIMTIDGTKAIKVEPTGGNWTADTTYKITVPTTVLDTYGNGVQESTFVFTVGPKPVVNASASYPAAFNTAAPIAAPYIAAIVTDDAALKTATLNSDNVTVTKKADGSAAPYTISNVISAKPDAADLIKVNGAVNNSNSIVIDGNGFANVVVGDILTVGGDQTVIVTAVNAGTITVDRAITAADNEAVVRQQGVVFALDTNGQLAGNTEYNVTVKNVQDAAGNTADATVFTFRTVTATTDLTYVSGTVENNATGVAVNKALEFTFNTPIDSTTLGTGVVVSEGATDITADCTVELKSGDDKTIVVTPISLLKADTAYSVTFTTSLANTYGAGSTLATQKVIAFQTEVSASIKPQITSALFFDATADGVSAGDKIILELNTPVDDTTVAAVAASTDFALSAGGVFGDDGAAPIDDSTVSVSADGKTITITLGTDPILFPNSTKINVKSGTIQDLNGVDFATTAVTITK